MGKRLVIILIVILLVTSGIWFLVFRKAGMYKVEQGVPSDAVFVVKTPSFSSIRDKLYKSHVWTSLKEYPYFGDYHARLDLADSLCDTYPVLRRLLTDRPFAVSCHCINSSVYDFLYVCDLGKLNVIQALDDVAGMLPEKGRVRKKGDVTEVMLDDQAIYYAIKANLLLVSLSEELVQRSYQCCGLSVAESQGSLAGDITLNVDHGRLGKWMGTVFGDTGGDGEGPAALATTGLALTMEDNALCFKGETYPNPHYFSLLSALNLIDGHKSDVRDVAGSHIAACFSVCFSSFAELEDILLENYKVNHLKEYTEYERTLARLDKFLGVHVAELFTSWIGNEIAVIKPAVDKEKRLDNLVLAVRSRDIDLAKDQLAYLTEQIGRRTPVRFRGIEYNGHTIHYLSLKGFFNLFLGPVFQKFDRPYYTFIGDYVVFSNSSSTLATMIKDYALGNTLAHDGKYNQLMDRLGNSNNVYGYISSPETYEYLCQTLKPEARTELMKNKGAFQSFESVGLALVNAGSGYETRVVANHNVNAAEDYEVSELSRELEDLADRIESGYYAVVIPDSIAVSVRGSYAYRTDELAFSGKLSNGDPDGVWNINDGQGHLLGQYIYKEGKPGGAARFFYPDGIVRAQVDYEEGRILSYKEFFQDGTLKTELEYNKGVRHGTARFYYSTGHLFGEGKYRKGRRSGTWKYYRVTGEVERKMKF